MNNKNGRGAVFELYVDEMLDWIRNDTWGKLISEKLEKAIARGEFTPKKEKCFTCDGRGHWLDGVPFGKDKPKKIWCEKCNGRGKTWR